MDTRKTELARLNIEEPKLPAWVTEKQPQNVVYWQTVFTDSAIRKERERIGESLPPFHDWWTAY